MSIFIAAHACKLSSKFNLGMKNTLYFKAIEGNCAVNDVTQLDLNIDNYSNIVKQTSPSTKPFDYSLDFYDPMLEYGLASMGIFYYDQNNHLVNYFSPEQINLFHDNGQTFLLSDIINTFSNEHGFRHFYLNICRTSCDMSGGKRKKSKTKSKRKRQSKKRKDDKKH